MTDVPTHIGYIVDGNRRWAKSHGIPSYEGHLAGYNTLKDIIFDTFERGVQYVSIYAFSTENWKRGEGETGKLMKLALRGFHKDLGEFKKHGIRVRILGTPDGLSDEIIAAGREAENQTADYTNGTLCICFNYGGQHEIIDAFKRCLDDGLTEEDITEEAINKRLYAPDVPVIDMVVRTSGEHRLSNFMLWRVAYSEFLFLDKYWPDMTSDDVTAIIEEYTKRSRRFGG